MNYTDLITKYIQKKASAEDLIEIKKLSMENPDFKKQIIFQMELQRAIQRDEKKKLKANLQELEKAVLKDKINFLILWKVAAILIVLLSVSGLLLFKSQTNYEKIYSENFKPYSNIIVPRVRESSSNQNKKTTAFKYYDNHNYAEAITSFEALYSKEKDPYIYFYYAMSLMANNQVEEAIEALESSDWQIPKKLEEQTDWYIALGYLKLRQKNKAIPYLEKVIERNQARTSDAKKILIKIK